MCLRLLELFKNTILSKKQNRTGLDEVWEQDLDKLLNSDAFGFYQYGQVNQIVLLDKKEKIAWNYFTHIHFSKTYTAEKESRLLEPPVNIGKNFKLYISQYTISKQCFWNCVHDAVDSKIWTYTDSKITEGDRIDEPFITPIKYVAGNDPMVSIYGKVVPLEKSLYGSNFMGNYYIFEVYAKAEHIKELLKKSERQLIQQEINKCKLNYQLEQLNDRIGNIVCRFENEVLKAKATSLGSRGIEHRFELEEGVKKRLNLHFHIEQEHDNLLYECRDEDIILKPNEIFVAKEAQPSQCKTTVTVTDKRTGLVLFRYIADQSVYSSYRGQISLPKTLIPISAGERRLIRNGKTICIPLNGIREFGTFDAFTEMLEAGKRQQHWEDDFFQEHKYLNFYQLGEKSKNELHHQAILDVQEIINQDLLWDLQEICLIDPYLSANDILDTVVFCEKENIYIRALTDLHKICENKEASKELLTSTDQENRKFESAKSDFKRALADALGTNCDLHLSFRTIYEMHGSKFHDRYLILKYKINKTRVWSLGASVNSLGKSHHIIQIVESPTLVEDFFNRVWNETEVAECKIYDSSDYTQKSDTE